MNQICKTSGAFDGGGPWPPVKSRGRREKANTPPPPLIICFWNFFKKHKQRGDPLELFYGPSLQIELDAPLCKTSIYKAEKSWISKMAFGKFYCICVIWSNHWDSLNAKIQYRCVLKGRLGHTSGILSMHSAACSIEFTVSDWFTASHNNCFRSIDWFFCRAWLSYSYPNDGLSYCL